MDLLQKPTACGSPHMEDVVVLGADLLHLPERLLALIPTVPYPGTGWHSVLLISLSIHHNEEGTGFQFF